MLPHRRRGPVELKVRKLERAFKEQEGARRKAGVAFRLAVLRRRPQWMKVAEARDDRTKDSVKFAQATDVSGAGVTGKRALRGEAGHGVHEAGSSRLARCRFARRLN